MFHLRIINNNSKFGFFLFLYCCLRIIMDKGNTHKKKTDMKSVKKLMKNEHNKMNKIIKEYVCLSFHL